VDLRQWLFEFYVGSGGAQVPDEDGLNIAPDCLVTRTRCEICYDFAKFGL
jgi:hypothetical protein